MRASKITADADPLRSLAVPKDLSRRLAAERRVVAHGMHHEGQPQRAIYSLMVPYHTLTKAILKKESGRVCLASDPPSSGHVQSTL